jgi:hypothetical protein
MNQILFRVCSALLRNTSGVPRVWIILAAGIAAALPGLAAANLFMSTAWSLHDRGEIRAAARQSKAVTVQPALMEIVAAPVVDSNSELFIGTGDGSNGSWVRP